MEVTKRGGRKENIDLNKIHRVLEWAAEGLDVSVSQVEINSQIQLYEGISTADIHKTLVQSAANLISVEYPDYQYMAARLSMFDLRKEAYGTFVPPTLSAVLTRGIQQGWYDWGLAEVYTAKEIRFFDTQIKHERDLEFTYTAVEQLRSKYLVQDRVTGRVHESPQIAFMLMCMAIFSEAYEGEERTQYVLELYNKLVTEVSLSTPIMAGMRTPVKQFASCVLIETADTLDSIKATSNAIVDYISRKAGVGVNVGRIRAEGSPIRGGNARHTGVIPFLKLLQASVKSCSQGGVRGGAATFFYPVWHAEFESLIVLKNNRGVEENRVRQVDYGVQLNGFFYEKLIKGERIHFFSPHDVPDLYEAFFADQDKFAKLYKEAVQNNLATGSLPAVEVFTQIMQERAGTGRIYIQNVDHCNNHSPFNPEVAPIRQSNLCVEIALPTEPVKLNGDGLIALCTLAALNARTVDTPEKMQAATKILVRALDAILDYQEYPLPQAKRHSKLYRPLGIGIIDFASALAAQGYNYSSSDGNNWVHEFMESFQYNLMAASVELAKEKGACEGMDNLAHQILPVDTYKRDVDAVHTSKLKYDWDKLSSDIKEHGLRNATVSAFMPSETSSQISNSTNGIEPPRQLVSTKQSKDGMLKQVVPLLGSAEYETYWDMVAKGNKGNLEKIGIMQKFVCQSISTNLGYDPQVFGGQVPLQVMLQDLLYAYKLGIKTLYYHNTRDSIDIEAEDDNSCDSGGCKI